MLFILFTLLVHADDTAVYAYSLRVSLSSTRTICSKCSLKTKNATTNHSRLAKNRQITRKLILIEILTIVTCYIFVIILQLTDANPDYLSIDLHRRCYYQPCIAILLMIRSNATRDTFAGSNQFYASMLLSLAGDVHPNPGPASFSDSSSDSTSSYFNLINSGFSVMHLNIQSIRNKLDILEIEAQPYDVLVFTETWLSPEIANDNILIPNFSPPFRCDRTGRPGGGVAIYVRDTLYAKELKDLSINNLEAVWIELHLNRHKLIVGGIYRPPDSNNNHWTLLQESVDRAFNQTCDNILVTGDFNINIHNNTSKQNK